MTENQKVLPGYDYLCVIQGLNVEPKDVPSFEHFLLEKCNVRIQFLETYKTLPDVMNGQIVPDTGGRHDVIFAIFNDDYNNLNIAYRMELGIRWLDDALSSDPNIYESRIHKYSPVN